MGVLSVEQIQGMGFSSVGVNPRMSDHASFYNCANIAIGNNVRIDDFCVLSAGVGGIVLADYIHIASFSLLVGAGRIVLEEFVGFHLEYPFIVVVMITVAAQ